MGGVKFITWPQREMPLFVPQRMFDHLSTRTAWADDCASGRIRPVPMLKTHG